jgi:hypothetical protein
MLKKSLVCVYAAAAALFMIAAPVGASAAVGNTKAQIPFEFVVSGLTMPAGDYTFEMTAGGPVVGIRNSSGQKVLVFLSRRAGHHQAVPRPTLVFDKKDGKFVLREVVSSPPPEPKSAK